MKNSAIYVWDSLVRIFHWSLVLAFTLAYLTEDDLMTVHEFAGYVVLGLVGFRIVWGFIGTRYARFSDFIYRPAAVIRYIKTLTGSNPTYYIGHNPAGGLMVILLLVMLALTSWTGIKAQEKESTGQAGLTITLVNAAYADSDEHENENENEGDEFWEEIHEASANLTLFLIFLHIAGVLASSFIHRENLVRAMITGYKQKKE